MNIFVAQASSQKENDDSSYMFSPSALKVYNSLSFDNEEDKYDIDIVLDKMTEFCRGVFNETCERYVLNTCLQASNESIDEFYGALKFSFVTKLLVRRADLVPHNGQG